MIMIFPELMKNITLQIKKTCSQNKINNKHQFLFSKTKDHLRQGFLNCSER